MSASDQPQKKWFDVYPPPSTSAPPTVSREEVLAWLKEGKVAGKEFVVVDLRGKDHTVSYTKSLNYLLEVWQVGFSIPIADVVLGRFHPRLPQPSHRELVSRVADVACSVEKCRSEDGGVLLL
jgi:hypothetical protein